MGRIQTEVMFKEIHRGSSNKDEDIQSDLNAILNELQDAGNEIVDIKESYSMATSDNKGTRSGCCFLIIYKTKE